ncbi:hypothetical protein ACLHY1_25040, partial [Escherichia coli]
MGKGGGRAHTPREAKDNLKSTQMMSVIDAIGEGPIEGPVKGLQSILVNKTPLTDTDGNPVIHGVTAVWRAGEQEQTPPEGFESSGAETGLGVEVTKAKPVTRTITSANIDRLRVTFGVRELQARQGHRDRREIRETQARQDHRDRREIRETQVRQDLRDRQEVLTADCLVSVLLSLRHIMRRVIRGIWHRAQPLPAHHCLHVAFRMVLPWLLPVMWGRPVYRARGVHVVRCYGHHLR